MSEIIVTISNDGANIKSEGSGITDGSCLKYAERMGNLGISEIQEKPEAAITHIDRIKE